MHIDRTNEITVSREATGTACPISPFGLVFVPTSGTLARCSSFGAREARDVSLFRFVGEIIDVLAIFPQGHALIVMSAIIPIVHPVGIAHEETSHLILHTEVDDLASGLVAQITDPPFTAFAHLVPGVLQFLPATRILLAKNWVKTLRSPGILHPHRRLCLAQLARGFHLGKEGVSNHLYRLAMQGELALGRLLQLIAPRPFGMSQSSLFVRFHAEVPDLGRLLLRGLHSAKLASRQVVKSIHSYGFHGMMIPWTRKFCKWARPGIPTTRLLKDRR